MEYFGNRLRKIRESHGLTQRQLEAKLDLGDSVISKWEKMAFPPLEGIQKFCDLIEMPLYQFFAPDNLIIPDLEPGEAEFMNTFKKIPVEVQTLIIEQATRTVAAFAAGGGKIEK